VKNGWPRRLLAVLRAFGTVTSRVLSRLGCALVTVALLCLLILLVTPGYHSSPEKNVGEISTATRHLSQIDPAIQQACLRNVASLYRPEYLTYPWRLKLSLASKLSRWGIPIPDAWGNYIVSYSRFESALIYFNFGSPDTQLTTAMNPLEFEVALNTLLHEHGIKLHPE
jgi:hypothetical protein